MLGTKEFYDLMAMFEKVNQSRHRRYDKENKDLWLKKQVYQDGDVNELFFAFLNGYSLAKSRAIQGYFQVQDE